MTSMLKEERVRVLPVGLNVQLNTAFERATRRPIAPEQENSSFVPSISLVAMERQGDSRTSLHHSRLSLESISLSLSLSHLLPVFLVENQASLLYGHHSGASQSQVVDEAMRS